MGSNFAPCGYADVESYVDAMLVGEFNHLHAFGTFCNTTGLTEYLIDHDWTHFALRYNGPGNVADYAGKLARAYEKHRASPSAGSTSSPSETLKIGDSGIAVTALQQHLVQLGYPVNVDGDFGSATEHAVRSFQYRMGLLPDGIAGPNTLRALYMGLPQ
jgi:hypothetical protein